MYCWNCGHKNSDENKFCGECGEKQGRPADTGKSGPSAPLSFARQAEEKPTASAARPVDPGKQISLQGPQKIRITDPLVEYAPPKRRASDKFESAGTPNIEAASPTKLESPSSTRSTPEPMPSDFGLHPVAEQPPANSLPISNPGVVKATNPLVNEPGAVRESLVAKPAPPVSVPPIAAKRPANRISGPSFLGLSDPAASDSSGNPSYLLEDEDGAGSSSSWPGVLALTLLIVFGVVLVKEWGPIHDFVTTYGQKVGISRQQSGSTVANDAIHHPQAAVSSNDISAANTASSNTKSAAGDRQVASNRGDTSAAQSSDNLQKPESDKPGTSTKSTPQPKSEPADASDASTRSSKPSAARTDEESESKKSYDNSQVQLAEKYIYGRGVPQDCGRAISMLQSAAGQQNPNAQIKLGALFATGQCVSQDRAQAYRWYSKAKQLEPGNTWLQYSLNSLWASMSAEERQRAQSM